LVRTSRPAGSGAWRCAASWSVVEAPAAREETERVQVDGASFEGEQAHPGELAPASNVVAGGSGSLTKTDEAS